MKKISTTPIGAHVSISKGYKGAFEEAFELGASSMQIFGKSPMSGRLREVSAEESREVARFENRDKIKYAVIHSSYLLNFAKKLPQNSYESKSLIEDLRSADKLGADGVVLHMGKAVGGDRSAGTELFIENVVGLVEKSNNLNAKIILENTAGQGTELGFKFEEYGYIFNQIKKRAGKTSRLAMCLDTAHAFAGGYDLKNSTGIEKMLSDLNKYIGFEHLACVHFNDSKKPFDSRVDRHQDIGYGEIGDKGLKTFVARIEELTKGSMPLILETPTEHASYEKQLAKMANWLKS